MPAKPRPPMPKLPPFALAAERPPRKPNLVHLFVFLAIFATPLFLLHVHLLSLPYFWDELGQFVPSALDLARSGALVTHSAIPNVHPPGVAAYLALFYKIFGFSIPVTRVAMLLLGALGLLFTFLLAIELSRGAKGVPAFLPPILLLVSPLFYTQSMLAQLDMPAMVLTLLALLLFITRRYAWTAVVCVFLVLAKETGLVTPLVFFCVLAWRREWKRATFFMAPAIVLAGWLVWLHAQTGYWLGDPEFGRYNVNYALHPVRMSISLARRVFYIFFAEMRWIGTLIVFLTVVTCKTFHTRAWAVSAAVCAATIVLVSMLGGAELERYVLPVLPLFYIAVSVGLTTMKKPMVIGATTILLVGLAVCIVWNPPYPFPFENNYSLVDFVQLQQLAAEFAERNLQGHAVATAWPYTAALRSPDWGFVKHGMTTIETGDLHYSSVKAIAPARFDTLITYTREWTPRNEMMQSQLVQRFLRHFYQWEPDITPEQCRELGLHELISWSVRGQTMSVFSRKHAHE